MTKVKYVVPDGGMGWVIVLAFALNNIVMIPIIQNFGMIYGSAFKRYGISATQSTLIINVNQAFGMVLGMMNGPLLRKYGYRKMAVAGSLLYSGGVILTSFGSSLNHFIITYGMITSLGMSMGMSSFSLAINTYFREKRGRAMGLAMTITGIGPIVIPYLVSFLLYEYGNERTMFILGGLSLNSLVGALLLHPIKWYAKPEKETKEDLSPTIEKDPDNDEFRKNYVTQESASLLGGSTEKCLFDVENDKIRNRKISRTMTIYSTDFNDDNTSIYGFEMPISMQNGSLLDIRDLGTEQEDENTKNKEDKIKFQRQLSAGNDVAEFRRSSSFSEMKARKFSIGSRYGDLGLTKKVLTECPEEEREFIKTNGDYLENKTNKSAVPAFTEIVKFSEPEVKIPERPESLIKRLFIAINKFFDLDLLRDPVYVNIMMGMSLAIFAEFNFSTLTPFILKDMHLTDGDIAKVMSSVASTDLILRAVSPYIGEFLRKSPRMMYLVSLFLLIITRTGLLMVEQFYLIVVVAFGLGVAKGVRTVYMTLVIPSHVPLEKLANASSIQSLVNGFFLMVIGPCLGVIRDLTGSYVYCIILINGVTSITIIMWLSEFGIKRILRIRKQGGGTSENLEQDILKKVESQ
ncbi:uncharacterized protein LOC100115191 isoform X1 [Nasonia vitripennis]|uniref:Major facilitator superfamily (MFS) profile domain-containing protein n=3 Tax=Nasonia vitripennis TaxID=7425 RepID=A0A7M7TET6_NASVI|nr:uncharacterized protein LOC100115191 isoform X1 [Nasonia vitripennis]XP_032458225.1 uncharacterized protein LOC100115191 isoform X1 [Nasonia vitripennis]